MQLLFLRHGPAEPKNGWRGEDEERPLTAQGRLLVSEVACSLPKQRTLPELIVTSPLARARQTAEIVGECLGLTEEILVDKRLAPGFGQKQLEKVLRDHGECGVLMLVAHDPDVSELVRDLTGAGRLSVRKGGLAQVDVPDPKVLKGRLISLLVPTPADPQTTTSDADS